jgi:hypothetical protein
MANVNSPCGLVPIGRSITGGPMQGILRRKAAGYGTRIRQNDVVNRVADGSIERSITPGTTVLSGVSLNHGAASTATEHIIIEDPFQLYKAQGGGATGLAAADAGLNANLTLGTTAVFVSDDLVNDATEATTASFDVKIHDLLADPDNTWGQWVKIVVQINSHRLQTGVAGV